jgi:hypothetical protein
MSECEQYLLFYCIVLYFFEVLGFELMLARQVFYHLSHTPLAPVHCLLIKRE